MEKHYDFSKAERGKFYVKESEIQLPIYLESENQEFLLNLANQKKIALSELINRVLSQEKHKAELLV